jgi:hypothetical protein
MIWTAISSSGLPFVRLAFAGSFLVGAIGLATSRAPQPSSTTGVYQLVLHTDRGVRKLQMEHFGSQWNLDMPVLATHDASDGKVLTFHHRWPYIDGCYWESTETLQPISATQYRYFYTDQAVECDEDFETDIETVPSVRSGVVDVVAVK